MIQHYVPQFLLKPFCIKGSSQIWVYDKTNDKIFQRSIKNVASEDGFYNFNIDGEEHSLEKFMHKIETSSAPIIRKIIKTCSLISISEHERKTLSTFFSIQLLRTKHHRENYADLTKQYRDALLSRGFTEKVLSKAGITQVTREDVITGSLASILEYELYAEHFFSKDWLLHKSNSGKPLYISDNPICLFHEQPTDGFWSNLGLAVPGIQIYIPLSNDFLLGMLCPTIKQKLEVALQLINKLPNIPPDILAIKTAPTKDLIQAIKTGEAIALNSNSTTHFNSLQVTYSERFVYCGAKEFDLVQDMLQKIPEYRHGRRVTIR
jgi:hypothetical protein